MRNLGGVSILCSVLGLLGVFIVFSDPASANDQEPGGNVFQVDLKNLEDDLRGTDAISLSEKLSLKKDLDRLVEKFHAFHNGGGTDRLDQLESSFHQLIDRTLTLLQASDPDLYQRIAAARSDLWNLLRNRETFQAMVVIEEPTYVAM